MRANARYDEKDTRGTDGETRKGGKQKGGGGEIHRVPEVRWKGRTARINMRRSWNVRRGAAREEEFPVVNVLGCICFSLRLLSLSHACEYQLRRHESS